MAPDLQQQIGGRVTVQTSSRGLFLSVSLYHTAGREEIKNVGGIMMEIWTDQDVDFVYGDQIYSTEGVPKRMSADKFFGEIVPARREKFRLYIASGRNITMDEMIKACHKVMDKYGNYRAICWAVDHIQDVNTSEFSGENPLSDGWFKAKLLEAAEYDVKQGMLDALNVHDIQEVVASA
jgi:hypothetical protein